MTNTDPLSHAEVDALLDSEWRRHGIHVAHLVRHVADTLFKNAAALRSRGLDDLAASTLVDALLLYGLVGVKEDLALIQELKHPDMQEVLRKMREVSTKLATHGDGCVHRAHPVKAWNIVKEL